MDLFYYGSQDVPLPLGGDGKSPSRARPRGEPAVCESCSAPVTALDLESGRATEEFGLVLCERCRLRARAEERVELYFCDRCQVSVPVFRVDTGEALAGDGRLLCLSCREREQSGGPPRWMMISAIVLVLAVGLALIPDGNEEIVRHVAPNPRALALTEDLRREILNASPVSELQAVGAGLRRVVEELDRLKERRVEALDSVARMNEVFRDLEQDLSPHVQLIQDESAALERDLKRLISEPPPRD